MRYALILAAAFGQLAAQRPYRPGIDVLDYSITIDLPDSGNVIRGDAVLTVRRTAPVDSLTLDLRALTVVRAAIGLQPVGFARTDSTVTVALPRTTSDTASDTTTFLVEIGYAGPVTDGLIARRDSAGRWTYFGDNWPNRARYWIPSVDHPSDKATVSWTIGAPPSQTVVANGALVETRTLPAGPHHGARTITRWRESEPVATYLMVIAAAPLVKTDLGATACGHADLARCVPQALFTAPEQRSVAPGPFARAGDVVDFFGSLVAPFPYEKLYHFQSETRFGGMENATAIFYADQLFRRNRLSEGIIAHETAHQWFGDAVTERDWPHLWLSEGFADYFSALWTQHAHGDSAFHAQMARMREDILTDTAAVTHRPVIDTVETQLLALLNTNSYQKGAWVLHMLRGQLGDSAFFRGVRDYYLSHKHGNALSDDLRASLERSSGQTLGAFFDQWLRRPGYPEMRVALEMMPGEHHRIAVTQSGRFGYFEFPLEVVLADAAGGTITQVVHVLPQSITHVDLEDATHDRLVMADPNVKLLARISSDHE